MIYGNAVGGIGLERTYILVDEEGNEFTATFVDNATALDATANDIRQGKMAATDEGVVTGEKLIPTYYTTAGYRVITAGSEFKITDLSTFDKYDYTELQAMICSFNSSLTDSVSVEKVVIGGNVYAVNSTEPLATVVKDSENKSINLGITNDTASMYILRYFTYKEVA